METLKDLLKERAKLTEKQALAAIDVFRGYLIDKAYDPDIIADIKMKARVQYDKLSDKADTVADKVTGKAEEIIHKARSQAKKAADKLSEYLDDEKKE